MAAIFVCFVQFDRFFIFCVDVELSLRKQGAASDILV
jgi:hypothetical protein